jgi:hypothetical protein
MEKNHSKAIDFIMNTKHFKVKNFLLKKNFKVITLIILIFTFLLGVLCIKGYGDLSNTKAWAKGIQQSYQNKSSVLEAKINEIDSKNQAMDTKLIQLEDKYYEDKLIKLLGKDKLISLAKEKWKYSLWANDAAFNDDHIYLSTKSVTIVFTENQFKEDVLPKSIHYLGSLTNGDKADKFYDHLIIETQIPYERKMRSNANVSIVSYTFKDVPRGSIITLRLSEPLRERLKLEYSILEVIINKN